MHTPIGIELFGGNRRYAQAPSMSPTRPTVAAIVPSEDASNAV